MPSGCKALGLGVVVSREPGGSAGAEAIRHVLLSGAAKPLGPHAEAILFAAARADHLRQTIRPALERGQWVISDRFADSTRIYQGVLGNVDARLIARLEKVTVGELGPDLTDHPRHRAGNRARARHASGAATRRSTGSRARRSIFTRSCARPIWSSPSASRQRCVVIDAGADPATVAEFVWSAVNSAAASGRSAADDPGCLVSRVVSDDDVEIPHPRATTALYGHAEAEQAFLDAYRGGACRMPG